MMQLFDARFEVVAELPEGGQARVFEVKDRVHQTRRALKLATRRGLLRRWRGEFVRLSELRHPNIVRVYDFGVTPQGLPYYTMELVRGPQLSAFPGRGDFETLGMLAQQALDALSCLHARGFVHRDVKPSNLLVLGEGASAVLRLIDLGLIVRAGSKATPAGTLPYIAPEVARGAAVDGRADLYSLGAVLYEALLPDDAVVTMEDVARRYVERPVSPNRLNPVIPAGLSAFVMRLIEPEPEARFADAEAAAEALAKVPGLLLGRGPARATAERMLRGGAVSHRDALVKRLLGKARGVLGERRGCCIALEAPIGAGKSPLLRELAMRLNLLGFRVLQPRTSDELGTPVTALVRAARTLNPLIALKESFEWPKESRRARTLSSELTSFVSRTGARLAEGFADAPTAILLDDLHRADAAALDVIASLARSIEEAPVLLLCAADPRPDAVPLAEALGAAAEGIRLGPLSPAEVSRLASHRLAGLRLPAPALDRLVHDSQGMPSLVERTLARLLVDGTIQRQQSSFVFVGGRYRPARHDADMVAARLSQAHGDVRLVLWAAAVLGHDLDAQSVAAVAAISVAAARGGLLALARLDILDPGEASISSVYKFASRSLLAAAYQAVPAAERRAFHDRAAGLLAKNERAAGRVEEQVEHLLKGSDDDRAINAAMEAGARAAAVFADRRAIEYFARAYARLRDTVSDGRAAGIALRLGKLFERTGELDRAVSWYRAAASAAAERDGRIEVEATLGQGAVFLLQGLVHDADLQAHRAKSLLERNADAQLLAQAERLQALVAVQRGEAKDAERLFLEALAAFEASAAEAQAVEVLLDLARLSRSRGELVQAVRYARKALSRARRLGDAAAVAEASTVLGRGFLRAGRFATARRALLRGLRVARASGDRLREAAVQRQMGNLRLRLGELDTAIEKYERALELARSVRARADESACLHNIGLVRARFGEFRAAITALTAAFDVAFDIGDIQGAAASAVELGHAHSEVGDLAAAQAALVRGLEMAAPLADPVVQAEGGALLAWVGLNRGDESHAARVGPDTLALVGAIEDPGDRALALYFAARCSIALGLAEHAREVVTRLAAEVDSGGLCDFAAALGCLRGQLAELCGERERAVTELKRAAEVARNSNLRPLEIEIRACLGKLWRGSDQGAEELTRAMELMREVAIGLPDELREHYLLRQQAQDARGAFASERERVFATE